MSEDRMAKGRAIRQELIGDKLIGDMAKSVYTDSIMQKFGDYATDAVFGGLWARPGLDLKTRTLICVISDTSTGRWPELTAPLRLRRPAFSSRGHAYRSGNFHGNGRGRRGLKHAGLEACGESKSKLFTI